MNTIKNIEREDVGGGMINTNVYMTDGSIIAITYDAVYLYDNIIQFGEWSHAECWTMNQDGQYVKI